MPLSADPCLPHYQKILAAPASPWLVMVHGAVQHSEFFSAQREWFRDRYSLLEIDLPGHGKSPDLAGSYGLQEYARSILAALRHADIGEAHFWGSHTGAAVGLMLTAQGSWKFQSLILEGAVLPGFEMPYIPFAIERAKQTAAARGVAAAQLEWFHETDWFTVIRNNPLQCRSEQHWEMIRQFRGSPWLSTLSPEPVSSIVDPISNIEIPVLLINGEHDVQDFLDVADVLERAMPSVKRHIISDAGGFPLWEFPLAVNKLVSQFLDDVGQKKDHRD